MIQRLSITNYLLIDELELDLGKGSTILTGETGSGKSILLGALALAMGERAEAGLARDPRKRCVIELELVLSNALRPWFEQRQLTFEEHTIVRRVLEPSGRSRSFINDLPVKLEDLKALGAQLIHIHSQHHTALLRDRSFILGMLDMLAGQADETQRLANMHAQWRAQRTQLDHWKEQADRMRNEREFLLFQLKELEDARLAADEFEQLKVEVARGENAEQTLQVIERSEHLLQGDDGAVERLQEVQQNCRDAADPTLSALAERLGSAVIEVKDIADEVTALRDEVSMDPMHLEQARERVDLIQHLLHKHRKEDISALIDLADELSQQMGEAGSLDEKIAEGEKQVSELEQLIRDLAAQLSKARKKVIAPLEKGISDDLKELGIPYGVIRFEHTAGELGPRGIDVIRTLFTANKDRKPAPLEKAASGGELSRVMLAMIARAALSMDLPTVIFDEIDTGVSGNVAEKVGEMMKRMAAERQLIAITHLPQIASKADHHFQVTKADTPKGVITRIDRPSDKERVHIIAGMLSGKKTSKEALANARVLLGER